MRVRVGARVRVRVRVRGARHLLLELEDACVGHGELPATIEQQRALLRLLPLAAPQRHGRRDQRLRQPRPRRGEHAPVPRELQVLLLPRREAAHDPLVEDALGRLLRELLDALLLLLLLAQLELLLDGAWLG